MTSDTSVLCCPDKFRGSLTAAEAAEALAGGVRRAGADAIAFPLADGGEGTLDVLCPAPETRRALRVTGPLGDPVDAEWGLRQDTGVVEMARASGLALVGDANDPLRATTYGTGELIRAAIDAGARRVIVAVGGSATVDGGLGALEALGFDLRGVDVVVACDVETAFLAAASVFGPQKGATPDDVARLEERLALLGDRYERELGRDIRDLAGSGAAGGLGGGLAAVGARLVSGAALVAETVGLPDALRSSTLAITGEGRFDRTSLAGKVVGHVIHAAQEARTRVAVVAGEADWTGLQADIPRIAIVDSAGSVETAHRDARRLVADAAEAILAAG